jgi:hypothetical protein
MGKIAIWLLCADVLLSYTNEASEAHPAPSQARARGNLFAEWDQATPGAPAGWGRGGVRLSVRVPDMGPDELLDSELDMVTGGSFDLGSIVGSIAKAVMPMAL